MKRMLVLGLLLALTGATAFALTATGTLPVSATVASTFKVVSVGSIAFGTVQVGGPAVTVTTYLQVQAPNGQMYAINMDSGANSAGLPRFLLNPPNTTQLFYDIFQPGSTTAVWGDTPGPLGNNVTINGTGATQTFNFSATLHAVPLGAATGNYADTVTITINY